MAYQNKPVKTELEADKTYAFCSCGESSKSPYCDGAHKGTEKKPVIYKSDSAKIIMACACGKSDGLPMCDGSH